MEQQLSNHKCPDCNVSFPKLISLSIHYRSTHKKPAKQLCIALFHGGVEPTCRCGCGQPTKYIGIEEGFVDYIRGHAARVHNNWGHNKEAQTKSQEVRRENWKNGTYTPWCKGKTKETDERLAKLGEKGSRTIQENQEELDKRSERMKQGRLDGTIPTLTKEKHPQWKGGISSLNHYCHSNRMLYNDWKHPILKKAEYKCSRCCSKKTIEVHHDKETFSDILRKIAKEHGWEEKLSCLLEPDNQELLSLKDKIVEAVATYHIENNVSGIVLCESCHKEEHANLNF